MAAQITIKGVKAKRGERMHGGSGWKLVTGKRVFRGTLLQTINFGRKRLAIFSVPK